MAEGNVTGFIGGGRITAAMIAGMVEKMGASPASIYVSDHKAERCRELAERYQVRAMVGAEAFLAKANVVILAVKPAAAPAAIAEIKASVRKDAVIVSVVAGLRLAVLEEAFGENPLVRVMPNTPLAVGAGMSAYALNDRAKRADVSFVVKILASGGRTAEVKEELLDAVTGLSGSGPAYGFLMIEALADGGVAAGLSRQTATFLAAQTLLGAAQMVLLTGKHPAVLRDEVTSPAGTTSDGLRMMETRGVRGALMEAVLAAAKRSAELGAEK